MREEPQDDARRVTMMPERKEIHNMLREWYGYQIKTDTDSSVFHRGIKCTFVWKSGIIRLYDVTAGDRYTEISAPILIRGLLSELKELQPDEIHKQGGSTLQGEVGGSPPPSGCNCEGCECEKKS